ncbi:hypothetical protein LCGC14_3146180, partial [marine sediment metagenome]
NRTAGESYESFWAWRRSHNPQHLVGEHGFAEAELRRWHDDMARMAYGLDPLSAWFDLTRNVAWDAWERVKGKARLAHELYTMAEIVRLYAREFHRIELLEEDEVWHGPHARAVKERRYGHPKVTDRRRDIRRRIAREFGLDGGIRVVWFVEGDTEKAFISRYGELTGFQCDARGIAIKNLKGSGGVKREHLRQRLEEARQEDQFTHVTVDSLPNMSKELRQLAHENLCIFLQLIPIATYKITTSEILQAFVILDQFMDINETRLPSAITIRSLCNHSKNTSSMLS